MVGRNGRAVMAAVLVRIRARTTPRAAGGDLRHGRRGGLRRGVGADQAVHRRVRQRPGPDPASWELWALLAAGVVGLALGQSALRTGVLAPAMAATNAVTLLISVVLGTTVFGEKLQRGWRPPRARCRRPGSCSRRRHPAGPRAGSGGRGTSPRPRAAPSASPHPRARPLLTGARPPLLQRSRNLLWRGPRCHDLLRSVPIRGDQEHRATRPRGNPARRVSGRDRRFPEGLLRRPPARNTEPGTGRCAVHTTSDRRARGRPERSGAPRPYARMRLAAAIDKRQMHPNRRQGRRHIVTLLQSSPNDTLEGARAPRRDPDASGLVSTDLVRVYLNTSARPPCSPPSRRSSWPSGSRPASTPTAC